MSLVLQHLLFQVAAAFLLGVSCTFVMRRVAIGCGMVAAPRNDRWHTRPIALLGGVGIYAAFFLAYFGSGIEVPYIFPVLIGASVLFLMGLIDDSFQLKPYVKLVFQFSAASYLVFSDLTLPWTSSPIINDLLTIFWIVGITNAINLLDNMDGLAGGIAAVALLFITITFLINGQIAEASLSGILFGAVVGFLVFNFSPASIFMGDSGSMFLGYMLGSIALLSDYGRTRNVLSVLLTPVLILLVPIFDTCLVTIVRKFSGRAVSQGGRDHTSHRLVSLGFSERKAVLVLYSLAIISGTFTLVLRWLSPGVSLVLVPGFAVVTLLLGIYLGKVKIYEDDKEIDNSVLKLIFNFSHKRRVFEVLLDVVLVSLAYFGSYLIRWDGEIPESQFAIILNTFPMVIGIEMCCLLIGGLYRGLWRYTGLRDLYQILAATLLSGLASMAAVLYYYNFTGPSRGASVINLLLLFMLIAGSRISFRVIRDFILAHRSSRRDGSKVLIYGAGDRGELLLRELINSHETNYTAVAFIDDDNQKVGKALHGLPIYNSSEIPLLVANYGVSEIMVSTPKVNEGKLEFVRKSGIRLRKMTFTIE